MSIELNTNRADSTSNQNLDKKKKEYSTNADKVSAIRSYSSNIVRTRKDLEKYLLKQGLKLVTSFSEFVSTNSFLESSYIMYMFHDNNIEKLSEFVNRNPQFLDIVIKIELELKDKTKLEGNT